MNMWPVGPGRRPKRPARTLGKHVPIRFPDELVIAVKRLADRQGVTVSAWIRNVVTREVAPCRPRPTTTASGSGVLEFQQAPEVATWTQADIDMIELAAVQGVEYLDLDESAYEEA